MKKSMKILLAMLVLSAFVQKTNAQSNKECVVIMSQNYTCEDPRNSDATWVLKKGEAIHVYKCDDGYEYSGPYTAASTMIPFSTCHIPGTVRGERYLVINATHLNLREKPSTSSGIYCYDSEYGGSVAPNKFLVNPSRERGVYGTSYSWKPYYLPKGTRMPYLGKSGNFYKTTFNGTTFYVSAKYCLLK